MVTAILYEARKTFMLTIDDVRASLAGKSHAHTFWHEGADYGFNRNGYPPYHREAAALARRPTFEFLEQHRGGKTS